MNNQIKILNLIQCLNLGGMERSSYLLVKETQAKGIDWSVQSVTPVGAGADLFRQLNVPVQDSSYQGKLGWQSHQELKSKVSSFSGDLILVTGPTFTGCLSARANPCKKILSIRFCHEYGGRKKWHWQLFYKYFGNDYEAILYNSPYTLDEGKNIAPWLKHKFHLIENTVVKYSLTSENEKKYAREQIGIPQDALVIGNAGWLIQRKRFDVFLAVCQKLLETNEKFYFVIAGGGPLRSHLENMANDLGISQRLKFFGWLDDLSLFYKSLDLLLFNSDSDASPRTVLEAMSYGIPVVASALEEGGGTKYLISHGQNGYLLTNHNINLLAEYCIKILSDSRIYDQFQEASIGIIKNRFNTELFVQKHLDIFEQVLKS